MIAIEIRGGSVVSVCRIEDVPIEKGYILVDHDDIAAYSTTDPSSKLASLNNSLASLQDLDGSMTYYDYCESKRNDYTK